MDSYAINFLSHSHEAAAVTDALELAALAKRWEPFDSPGEGRDWRLIDAQMSGAALVWEDRVVIHLQLLPKFPKSGANRCRRALRRKLHPPDAGQNQ